MSRNDTPSALQFSNLTFEDWQGTSLNNESMSFVTRRLGRTSVETERDVRLP